MRLTSSLNSFPRSNNASVNLSFIERPRKGLLSETMAWRVLLLSALGPAFSNILIYRLGDFVVTPSHLLLILAIISILRQKRRHEFGLIFPVVTMLLLDGYHAVVSGYVGEVEWLKSFIQMLTYSTCFIFFASFRSSEDTLKKIAPWAMKLGIFLGGIIILQFVLLGFDVLAYVPQDWAVKTLDFTESTLRYGGVTPAIGLATEPSYCALGLVTLSAFLLFLHNNNLVQDQKLFLASLSILFGGILTTFSLTGVMIAIMMLLGWLVIQRRVRLIFSALLTITVIGIVGANIGVTAPLQARFQRALMGVDNSAQIRIVAAVQLLFARSTSFENFTYGTGLGMETRELDTYLNIYREASLRSLARDEVKIHNILTTVRFFQGWLGLALYSLLLWVLLLPRSGQQAAFFPVLVFFILYHFASGLYLSPSFWSMIALMALLRRIQLGGKAPAF